MMSRVLPQKLQIQKIEDRFCVLNVCDDLDLLDLPSVVDKVPKLPRKYFNSQRGVSPIRLGKRGGANRQDL